MLRSPRRPSAGTLLLLLALLLVTILGGATTLPLRSRASDARADARVTRRDAATAERIKFTAIQLTAVSWEAVAEGAPNFTLAADAQAGEVEMRGLLARYRSRADSDDARRLMLLGRSISRGVDAVIFRIGANDVDAAHHTAAALVEPQSELIAATWRRLSADYARQAVRADRRASGALSRALGLALGGLAVALLVIVLLIVQVRRAVGRTREAARRRYETLLQHVSELAVVVDGDGIMSFATGSGPQLSSARMLDERPLEQLLGHHASASVRGLAGSGVSGHVSQWELPAPHHTRVEVVATDLTEHPDIGGLLLTVRDVSAQRALEDELRHRALHDDLTGLASRVLFDERVRDALDRGGRCAVAYIDLDDFKTINDSLGHAVGDELLVAVAERVAGCIGDRDTIARLGGDEFAVLLDEPRDDAAAVRRTEGITAALEQPFVLAGRPVRVQASIGIATADPAMRDPGELARAADLAMYEAKRAGKGRVAQYARHMLTDARTRLTLREGIRNALGNGELRVVYQPIVRLDDGRPRGAEALLRWRHPQLGEIAPDQFIELAEETGALNEIGRWTIAQALRQLVLCHRSRPDFTMAVNLAPTQLLDRELLQHLRHCLRTTGITPRSLEIEITESALIDDDALATRLQQLRDLGVRLAVDDFGTGYASLSYLKRGHVDTIKVDRSFVSGIADDHADASLVRSIIAMGRSLELDVVAEGIETRDQSRVLRDADCTIGQGYLFARPMEADALGALLATPTLATS